MNKDRVVIEEGGWRFVLSEESTLSCDTTCKAKEKCIEGTYLYATCMNEDFIIDHVCISATKIEPEPKMYFAWNREEARGLIGKTVEFHGGYSDDEWVPDRLDGVLDEGVPFALGNSKCAMIIRELQTIKLTRAELNEKYGVSENVVIVEGD
jgi:hypothetical protein